MKVKHNMKTCYRGKYAKMTFLRRWPATEACLFFGYSLGLKTSQIVNKSGICSKRYYRFQWT